MIYIIQKIKHNHGFIIFSVFTLIVGILVGMSSAGTFADAKAAKGIDNSAIVEQLIYDITYDDNSATYTNGNDVSIISAYLKGNKIIKAKGDIMITPLTGTITINDVEQDIQIKNTNSPPTVTKTITYLEGIESIGCKQITEAIYMNIDAKIDDKIYTGTFSSDLSTTENIEGVTCTLGTGTTGFTYIDLYDTSNEEDVVINIIA
ncbi:MAG: hypothetical protein K0B02_02185 [DPANN group archaeon]|nr:hypothetical protein [DPANN group archaeon]